MRVDINILHPRFFYCNRIFISSSNLISKISIKLKQLLPHILIQFVSSEFFKNKFFISKKLIKY
jgi:hypothetical protein